MLKELSHTTLIELATAGAVRAYTLTGQPGGYTLTVRYGMSEGIYVAQRGGPRLFGRVESAFDFLRELGVGHADVQFSAYEPATRPYRKGRAVAIAELDRLQGKRKVKKKAPAPPTERVVKPSAKAQIPLPGVIRGRKPG